MQIGEMYIQTFRDGTTAYCVPTAKCKNGSVKARVRSGLERKWRQDFIQPNFWNLWRVCTENEKLEQAQ